VLPDVAAIRYVTPLREGGSLPRLMEADDLGTYVVKFYGAGQGRKALVAEVVSARLARGLDLPVPDLVTVEVDPALAAGEPDEEIQDLLRASPGRNLGVDFLPGALDFDGGAFEVDRVLAGRVLWFDALVGNVDRSWRNRTCDPDLAAAEAYAAPLVSEDLLRHAVSDIPDEWLGDEPRFASVEDLRSAYGPACRPAGRTRRVDERGRRRLLPGPGLSRHQGAARHRPAPSLGRWRLAVRRPGGVELGGRHVRG
jgi:hypothetical protein